MQYKIGGGSSFDLLERGKAAAEFFDDFISGDASPASTGQSLWAQTETAGGGAIHAGQVGSEAIDSSDVVGYIRIQTGTATNGGIAVHKQEQQLKLGGGVVTIVARVKIGTLADVTDDYHFHIGLGLSRDPFTLGVGFLYERATSTNWLMTCSKVSTTKTSSGVAVTTGWVTFKIVINAAANSVEFFINGTSVGTVSTNIPNGASDYLVPHIEIEKTAGTNTRKAYVDYYGMRNEFTSARAA